MKNFNNEKEEFLFISQVLMKSFSQQKKVGKEGNCILSQEREIKSQISFPLKLNFSFELFVLNGADTSQREIQFKFQRNFPSHSVALLYFAF